MDNFFNFSYVDIQNINVKNETQRNLLPRYNITILRNIVIEQIEVYLQFLLHQIGFNLHINYGQYDTVYQDTLLVNSSLLNNDIDCVIIFLQLETLSPALIYNILNLGDQEIEKEKEHIIDYVKQVIVNIREKTNALILFNSFELPLFPVAGILDYQSESGQSGIIRWLNSNIRSILSHIDNSFLVDLNLCIARTGYQDYFDRRFWHIGKSPYTRKALREFSCEYFKFIRASKGKIKKCLVLDCDNVLWGGIVGEEGMSCIKLGDSYPGSIYKEFQRLVLSLYYRGVILAICSKNNEKDVMDVFENHPDMILNKNHISIFKANWNDKASNIKQIAEDLNIALDSIVFVDDSESEIDLVRKMLPDVDTLCYDINGAYQSYYKLFHFGLFDTLTSTSEDSKRNDTYRTEIIRKKLMSSFNNLDEYYYSMNMEIVIGFADKFSISRIAQLTQKTNQFNLTTKRYSELDIRNFSNSDQYSVLYLKFKDRLAEYGIVGVCILNYSDYEVIIDTFLLSCRVLGRKVEEAFIAECLEISRKRKVTRAYGLYRKTSKNEQVENFYKHNGFDIMNSDPSESLYKLDMEKFKRTIPAFLKVYFDF